MDLCKAQTEMKEYDIGTSKPTIHWWLAQQNNVNVFMVGLVVMNLRSNYYFPWVSLWLLLNISFAV